MALMKFREENHVKRVGVRPGHDGTQIAKTNTAINLTAIVHTVTAAKTLFLTSAVLGVEVIAAGNAAAWIRDVGDVFWWYLFRTDIVAAQNPPIGVVTFWPPVEVPAGYDIVVMSAVALLKVRLSIHGWEE